MRKSINIRLDSELYESMHRLMGMKYLDQDDILIERLHQGSHQDFYRIIISRGIKQIKKEWDERKKQIESQDSDR